MARTPLKGPAPHGPLKVTLDESRIDAAFAELNQCHAPGAAVGIAIDGEPVYRKAFGLANMELPVLLSPTIRMRIASTTKHFTCLAYLLLCEEGRACVDDPISKFVPQLHPRAKNVRIRHLMGNTSGLLDAFDVCFQFSGAERSLSSEDLLRLYRTLADVNAAPGETWIYNNGGFLLLTAAIERITGEPLEDVLRERILSPLRMYDTVLRRTDTNFLANSAAGHVLTPAGKFEKSRLRTAFAGEGGLVSSVDDMLRWMIHMDAPLVGSPTTWELLKSSQTLANGTATGYGLGLMSGRHRGTETLFHDGGWMGASSQMIKVPAAHLDVVVMSNRSDASATLLAGKVLDALIDLDLPSPGDSAASQCPVTGTFVSPSNGRVVQLFIKDGRQMVSVDGWDMEVTRDESGAFWPSGMFSHLKQSVTVVGIADDPHSIRLSDFGNVEELQRVEPVSRTRQQAFVGAYWAKGIATRARVCESDGELECITEGHFGSVRYQLECIGERAWRAKCREVWWLGGILYFEADHSAFRFSTYRTRALVFRRES